jgi:hypothetical protein
MSKITFEFNLPEEDSEFEACANARNLATILWDLDQWLQEDQHMEMIPAWEVRSLIREKLRERGMTWECVIWK